MRTSGRWGSGSPGSRPRTPIISRASFWLTRFVRWQDKDTKILTIDCAYQLPQFACAYLARQDGRALFIDNNTAHAVPRLLEALGDEGLRPEQVEYVIITHVHLDHAGGTSRLMAECPNAVLLAHPKAAAHMIDPGRLIESARRVYGEARFRELYGEILPVPRERVREVGDGERVRFGQRELVFLHTRGHANHHFCIHDPAAAEIFTGDSFGVAYPALQKGKLFVFASTSPTDFNAPEARKSIRCILETGAERAYLTHFGPIEGLTAAAEQLGQDIDFSEELLEKADRSGAQGEALTEFCRTRVRQHFEKRLAGLGIQATAEDWRLLALDMMLNADGLAHVVRRMREKKGSV